MLGTNGQRTVFGAVGSPRFAGYHPIPSLPPYAADNPLKPQFRSSRVAVTPKSDWQTPSIERRGPAPAISVAGEFTTPEETSWHSDPDRRGSPRASRPSAGQTLPASPSLRPAAG